MVGQVVGSEPDLAYEASAPIRVLHVDDEPNFAETAARLLEARDERLRVEPECDPEAVLERLATGTFDCVVSDYEMPRVDGLELLERVRGSYPELPFVLFTGKGSEEIASEAISAGVTDYLQKTTGTDQYDVLANRVTNAVASTRARQQGRRDRRAMAAAWDGIATFDDDGTFTYVNESYADTLGYAPGDLVGQPWETVYPEDVTDVVPEEILPAVRETGTWTGTNRLERADGSTLFGEHTVADVDFDGFVCVLRDRSERHELDMALRHERERFRLLVEAVDEYAIFVLDADGTVASWNAGVERIEGYAAAEILGTHFSQFYDAADREAGRPEALLERAVEAGQVREEAEHVRADGSTFWANVTVTPLTEQRDHRGFAVVIEDITDRKRRQRREQRARAYRERLTAVTTDPDRSDAETLRAVLDLGVEYLGLGQGYLVAIDRAADRHEVRAASGGRGGLAAGTTSPLSETVCRRTVETDGALTIYNAAEEGWEDDPAVQRFDLGCYLGAKVVVDDDLFGTVCFVDEEPREPFREDEKAFVELLTRWVATVLGRHDDEFDWPVGPD